jgi:D-alanyl-lipoteichoic acid acyltransferase DltB (MBOAT superfamily)
MTLLHILVFTAFALLAGWLAPPRWRGWLSLGSSLLAVYWVQPATPVRHLDFWLPTVSIALTVWVWSITQPGGRASLRSSLAAAVLVAGVILLIAADRYLEPVCCLTPTRPPELLPVILALAAIAALAVLTLVWFQKSRFLPWLAILTILLLFVILKSEPAGQAASAGLRRMSGQDPSLASFLDLRWLGFSFLAFRLLHVLRDYQAGRLPAYAFGDFLTYALFFPAYTAGPIDRSQRFIGELCAPKDAARGDFSPQVAGLQRILTGVFEKFVLADSLALFALNGQNAAQVTSSAWAWALLYAYALRIYFDFSGYTDIALGLGQLVGINLPENFSVPYRKTNLTAFWNSWHITLAQWFRAYVFNPFTRSLRTGARWLPAWVVVLAAQLLTMLLIGLWHGITINFAAWGLWHGVGLFVHNRWAGWLKGHPLTWKDRPRLQPLLAFGGWLLTFNYVALSWVWFALPSPGLAVNMYRRLLGIF